MMRQSGRSPNMPAWFSIANVMTALGVTEYQVYKEISPAMMMRMGFISEQEEVKRKRDSQARR